MKLGNYNINMLICFLIAFLVTAVIMPALIPYLRKLKFGQQILDEGPKWHEKKSGTPTMGGIGFIIGVGIAVICALLRSFDIKLLMMAAVSLGFGAIGFLDDYVKVVKKQNQGLTASQKFFLQAALAVLYVVVLMKTGELSTTILIPFTNYKFYMPWWLYVPFILFVVTGTVNAVNLTDGIDGLAASVTVVVSLFFGMAAALVASDGSAYFAFALLGGVIGFLIYNKYPAKVFMGDTGSLYLGGALSVLAVGLKMPLVLIICGFVYLFETLSVIMQVASFKLTGKRIFKMSPIHHHFEMCGWSERKIVLVFTLAAAVLSALAYISIQPFAA
ncbi:MAG: phospho-N-acetylmuramoyl-pentapeptide-transferase [Eubacteriales bacterium]|nr:phospho-N-acetylmuramoyl-pentapeptide-transferase [Eubacteriales bacterium]